MKRLFFIILLAGAGFADSNLDAAIGWLKSAQDPATGEINHYGVWGTAWGTIALAQYGENESTLNKSLEYIQQSQNNDGGIPYELGSPWGSGVDYSAPAILAFAYANKTPYIMTKNNKTAMEFIWGTQGASGGFGEWGEDTVSTSLAVMALSTISENLTKTGKDPVAFILSKQNSTDGGFEWWTKSEATAQALIALNAAGVNNSNTTAGLYYLKSLQNTTTGAVVDPYMAAFSAIAFHAYGWGYENEQALGYLRSVQNESGRIGRTNATQASDALTTALSALAFMNFSLSHIPACGNSLCELGESCSSCPSDCGSCTTAPPTTSGAILLPKDNNNLGDIVSIMATQVENITAYLDGSLLGGTVENGTYRYNFTANQTGNFTLTFNISGNITEKNFSVSDRYEINMANPGSCTMGAASTIAFNVTDVNGNLIQNASVFACLNGNCAQTTNSYQYTCAVTNSLYVNASKGGNFGYAQIEFSGTNPSPGGGGGSYVTVEIEFPANSGKHDISRVLNFGECEYAYDCFAKVASLDCGWFSAGGALACPGSRVSKTCLATGVDGVKAGTKGWWSFYSNGGLSAWGISCYKVNKGDRIKLNYAGEYMPDSPPQPNIGSGPAPPPALEKNKSTQPKEMPAQKPAIIERGGFRVVENIGKALVASARKSKVSIVSGANAPCPTCDFASALLLKSGLDGMNISAEMTTDDRTRECREKEIVIFVGGPAANRGVPTSYLNITGSSKGAIYNITQNCFVVAGNTREMTNKAVSALMETFK